MSTPGGPLTTRTAELLGNQISSGVWSRGVRLPSDAELARQLGIGVNTVRRALSILAADGLVERRVGAGTVVLGVDRSSHEPLVGVMVPKDQRYFPPLVAGLRAEVHRAHGRLQIRSSRRRRHEELQIIDSLVADGADGLILSPSPASLANPEFLAQLEDQPVPVVLAARVLDNRNGVVVPHSALSTVSTDIRRGAGVAVHHLATSGRTRIGLLSSRNTVTSEAYYQGYLGACHDLDLTVPTSAVLRWRFADDRAARRDHTVRRYVAGLSGAGVDAVLCFDSLLAASLMRSLSAQGLLVPGDVAVVGFDEVGPVPSVPLTTVLPDRYEVGRLAAQTVLHQIETGGRTPTVHTLVTPQLVVRASSTPVEPENSAAQPAGEWENGRHGDFEGTTPQRHDRRDEGEGHRPSGHPADGAVRDLRGRGRR